MSLAAVVDKLALIDLRTQYLDLVGRWFRPRPLVGPWERPSYRLPYGRNPGDWKTYEVRYPNSYYVPPPRPDEGDLL